MSKRPMGLAPLVTALGQLEYTDNNSIEQTTILLSSTVSIKKHRWWFLEKKRSALLRCTMDRTEKYCDGEGDQFFDLKQNDLSFVVHVFMRDRLINSQFPWCKKPFTYERPNSWH